MLPRAVLTINMMCMHLFGFSATTRATGALAAFTGTAVAAGGIPTACAFTLRWSRRSYPVMTFL